MVSIRSNHGVWLAATAKVRQTKWREFTRTFATNSPETRYVREVIFGQRGRYTYWDLTTDTETLPPNSTEPRIVKSELKSYLSKHPNWDEHRGWKSALNNLQLLLLPLLAFNLIKPWLTIFGNPLLEHSFNTLIAFVDLCSHAFDSFGLWSVHPFCYD